MDICINGKNYEAVQYRMGEQDGALAASVVSGKLKYCEDGTALVMTDEGSRIVRPKDWIVAGPDGKLFHCQFGSLAKTLSQFRFVLEQEAKS